MEEVISAVIQEFHKFGKRKNTMVPDISKSEMDILFYLQKNERKKEDNLNPSELSSFLNLSRSSITLLLNEMEEKGYLHRIIDTKDRRKMQITITKKGNSILKKHFDLFYGNLKDALTYLGEEDAKELLRIMKKLNER